MKMLTHWLLACAAAFAISGCRNAPERPGVEVARPEEVVDFGTLYAQNCAACHGEKGKNGAAISLADPEYLAIAGAANIQRITANGVRGTAMPPFGKAAGQTDRGSGAWNDVGLGRRFGACGTGSASLCERCDRQFRAGRESVCHILRAVPRCRCDRRDCQRRRHRLAGGALVSGVDERSGFAQHHSRRPDGTGRAQLALVRSRSANDGSGDQRRHRVAGFASNCHAWTGLQAASIVSGETHERTSRTSWGLITA
jgi:cytochrome c5